MPKGNHDYNRRKDRRNQLIVASHRDGMTGTELSRLFRVNRARVYQILARARDVRSSGKNAEPQPS